MSDKRTAWFGTNFDALAANIGQVIRGKPDVIRLALVCLFAEGHLLLEDVPGTGKTTLARALAASLQVSWSRIQFTPDLLPSDVTGVSIFNPATREFEFKPGSIFANLVLADEVNRASPKTQSALLEVMAERQVTVDGRTRAMELPFMVVATQNPVDMGGTYELPEAQLDRFMIRTSIGYPDHIAETQILMAHQTGSPLAAATPVMTADVAKQMISIVNDVFIAPELLDYIVNICDATRRSPELSLGASPRAALALMQASRAHAVALQRNYVLPEDVQALAVPVLAHRVILTPDSEMRNRVDKDIILDVLNAVEIPQSRRP